MIKQGFPTEAQIYRNKEHNPQSKNFHKKKYVKQMKKLFLPHNHGFSLVELTAIVRVEADNNYTNVFIKDRSPICLAKTLGHVEKLLETDINFCRVHRSHLINLSFLRGYKNTSGGMIIMEDGSTIPLARRRYTEFMEKINFWNSSEKKILEN